MISDDPVVAEVLAASKRDVAAILSDDAEGFADLLSEDVAVHAPINKVHSKADSVAAFRAGFISYSAFDRKIEYAGRLGEFVVVMGEEILKPKGKAPNAGKTVHRRFSDIWRKEADRWRVAARQATVISVQ